MAQHDYVISNGTGAAVRSDLNNALAAIVSQNSGATAPSPTYAFQFWADTTAGVLKLRNSANSAWITLFQLDGEWTTLPVENGTAAAPSIYFKDSGTDTGFYSPGTDQVGISTGGTARLTIDANGNLAVDTNSLYVDAANNRVGIGSSSPSQRLTVAGNILTTSAAGTDSFVNVSTTGVQNTYLGFNNSGSTNSNLVLNNYSYVGAGNAYGLQLLANGAPAVTIDASQRVGIGNNAPQATLDVAVTRSATVDSAIFGTTGTGVVGDANRILIKNVNTLGGQNQGVGIGGVLAASASNDAHLVFYSNGGGIQERARLDSSGRWLLGTSSARTNFENSTFSAAVQVEGTDYAGSRLALIRNGGGGGINLCATGGASVGSNTAVSSGAGLGEIVFAGSDGSEFVNAASITAVVDATPGANDMPGRLVFSVTSDGASSPTERMRISNNGVIDCFVSGGEGLALHSAQSAGNSLNFFVGYYGATGINGTASYIVRTNGNVLNTNGSYTAISDQKLKENIVDANSQWNDLKAIKIRNWNFKTETGHETHRQIGPIAQELEQVCPGLVFEIPEHDVDGEAIKGVNQSILYMKAVKALQEAMERIEQLETSNADLLARVTALESA